jgi:NADPH-dependent 2,4-dienoyl-CoA reductase/sulfur reductase-like enzyme
MPKGVKWIRDVATEIDPDAKTVTTASGLVVNYDYLIVCPGIQLDFHEVPGPEEALGKNGVTTNYRSDLAPQDVRIAKGYDPWNRCIYDAIRSDQVRRNAAKDRLSGGRSLVQTGCAQ